MVSTRRDFLRTATGLVAATAIGGALVHGSADAAQAATRGGSIMNISVRVSGLRGPFAAHAMQFGVEGIVPNGGGAGAGAGKATFDNVAIEKHVDEFTPLLYLLSASGQHIERVEIALSDAEGNPSGTLMLHGVRVLNCRSSFHGGDAPTEALSLNYTKIELSVHGSTFGWDVSANMKI